MFEIPEGLAPALIPLAFLLGDWSGEAVLEVAGGQRVVRQRLRVEVVPGRDVLRHTSETWVATPPDDEPGEPVADAELPWETGFWRPGDGLTEVELVLAQAGGLVALFYGEVRGTAVELATDAVVTTATGPRVNAATRTYGRVEGDLAYASYLATPGQPLTGHAGARLQPTR